MTPCPLCEGAGALVRSLSLGIVVTCPDCRGSGIGRQKKTTPMELRPPAALGREAGEGDGGLSLSSLATNASHHSKNRGGRP